MRLVDLGVYGASGVGLHENQHTCASNCFLLGLAEARITRLPRSRFNAGRSSGGRGPRVGFGRGLEES